MMNLHLFTDILRNSILITGLVTIMMMLIEAMDIRSHGNFFAGLKKSRAGQVIVSALLGTIPGCIGGFAAVSLYTQRMVSFGALLAMMITSCGDEAFMMLALMPGKALLIFLFLLVTGIVIGIATDMAGISPGRRKDESRTGESHAGCSCHHGEADDNAGRHWGWKRLVVFAGVLIFALALVSGLLDHEHHTAGAGHGEAAALMSMNLLDETWMNILFAVLCIILLAVVWKSSDRFVEHQLWSHVIVRHAPVIFAWTFGVLGITGICMSYIDIGTWISQNTALMIILAAAIGLIPESGPHIIFVTMYAGGIVPLPVLLASCISQDGHSSLPLLAEDKKSFAAAKLLNFAIAVTVGFCAMLL